jgi:signal transduction histidine kinase
LAVFVAARLYVGDFISLLPLSSMTSVNLISIIAAIAYTTLLSIYYETVMRDSGALETATRAQRIQGEALREAMRKAELASRQKSIFLAKISHELRTPLNAVIGYSEMLRDELSSESINKQRALDLERINAAGRHLLALVTDVLDLPSIEARRLEVSIKQVHVSELLTDVTATAGPLIAKKHNRLVVQVVNDPGVIETDALKLRQAILNLLSNAAKFTSHGVITLKVMTKGYESSRRLIVEVRDTGIGMSEESLGRIFKAFSQAERDTTQKFGGTGLGLVLTERFCNMIGGTIHVESQLGEGSVFTIDIPCKAAVA